ncbi:MAG: hypothetical protein WKG06_03010 [Segetibacter sp.]
MSKSNKTVFSSTVFDLPKKRNNNDFIDFITTEYEKFAIVIRDFKGDIEKELRSSITVNRGSNKIYFRSYQFLL